LFYQDDVTESKFVLYDDSQSPCKNPGRMRAKQSCSAGAVHSVIKGLNSIS